MVPKISIKDCPGLCVTLGVECAYDEVSGCEKKAMLLERMEAKQTLKEDVWFVLVMK